MIGKKFPIMPEENKIVCLFGGGLFTVRKPGYGNCGQDQKVGYAADSEKTFSNGDRFKDGFQAYLFPVCFPGAWVSCAALSRWIVFAWSGDGFNSSAIHQDNGNRVVEFSQIKLNPIIHDILKETVIRHSDECCSFQFER